MARTTRSLSTLLIGAILWNGPIFAEEFTPYYRGFGGTLGVDYQIGKLGDDGMGLKDRTVTAATIEALPGYRLNSNWLLGLDLAYRLQHQQTALREAGGTNLKGQGYLLGLGAQYRLGERWAIQAAVDLFGRYHFDKQSAAGQDDHLESPLGLRLKAQYFLARAWTLDAGAGYQTWRTFHIGGVDKSEPAAEWLVGAGVTYHFGFGKEPTAVRSEEGLPPAAEAAEPLVQAEHAAEGTGEATATLADESPRTIAFASDTAEVDADARATLQKIARSIGRTSKVLVEGYADTSGTERLNHTLSRRRASNVRALLISFGVRSASVRAVGRGTANPVADNATPEGRARNRRAEIKED